MSSIPFDTARAACRAACCTLTRRPDHEYRVNFIGGLEATAYYTDDLSDAVNTARAMHATVRAVNAAQHIDPPTPPPAPPFPGIGSLDVIARIPDAVYLRIPAEAARVINGGCDCPYCKAHPTETPRWDTLCVPTEKPNRSWAADYAHTVHMPNPREFQEYNDRKAAKGGRANV